MSSKAWGSVQPEASPFFDFRDFNRKYKELLTTGDKDMCYHELPKGPTPCEPIGPIKTPEQAIKELESAKAWQEANDMAKRMMGEASRGNSGMLNSAIVREPLKPPKSVQEELKEARTHLCNALSKMSGKITHFTPDIADALKAVDYVASNIKDL